MRNHQGQAGNTPPVWEGDDEQLFMDEIAGEKLARLDDLHSQGAMSNAQLVEANDTAWWLWNNGYRDVFYRS